MFKRRRAASNPASKPPPSASASLAASKAFLKDQKSNASLSNAAAAVALRTHPSSPTAVSDTVTKRMVRKASISSHGSGSQQGPGLRRQSSTASMTERSFRSPSPSRNSPVADRLDDAPPVPAVPKDISSISAVRRRASSLEPPHRGGSPARRGGGRGHSLDGGPRASPTHGPHVVSLSQVPESDSDSTQQSINFSRPISPPTTVASPSRPAKAGHSGWFTAPVVNTEQRFRGQPAARPKTSDANMQYEARNTWQSVQNAADKPVSTRKTQLSYSVEGARLSTGSMRAKPSGTSVLPSHGLHSQEAVDPKSADAVYDPSTRRFIRKQDAMARFRQLHEHEEPIEHHYDQYTVPAKPQSQPQRRISHHSPVALEHVRERSQPEQPPSQPSPIPFQNVRDQYQTPPRQVDEALSEREPEHISDHDLVDIADDEDAVRNHTLPEDRVRFSRQTSEELAGHDIQPPTDTNAGRNYDSIPLGGIDNVSELPVSPIRASNQDSAYPRVTSPPSQASIDAKVGRGRGSVRSNRGSSLSPPRNAHFASGSLELPNGVKHQPPPRSISPAKSALKSSPSVSRRNSSPLVNNGRTLRKGPLSEASDATSEDGSTKKKKAVRVSFEETPVIAGTSAYGEVEQQSSPTGLGQSRWSANTPDDNLDDFSRPRPALPSFGSIRNKDRSRDEGEGAEKVTETVSSSMSTSVASMKEPTGNSSDHALGNILVNDFASGKQQNPLDPLPPEVTSVEGSGYYSDSGSSDTALNEAIAPEHNKVVGTEPPVQEEHSLPEPKTLTTPADLKPPVTDIPEIAIQPASPNLTESLELNPMEATKDDTKEEPHRVKTRRTFVPGGWDDDQESEQEDAPQDLQSAATVPPTRVTFAEQAPPRTPQNQELESSNDDDSIYSDAYEELTDTDDGGFASIDKILESSVSSLPAGLLQSRFAERESANTTQPDPSNEDAHAGKIVAPLLLHEPGSKSEHQDEGGRQTLHVANLASNDPLPVVSATPHLVEQKPVHDTSPKAHNRNASAVPKASQPSQPPQQPAQPRKSALKKATAPVTSALAPEPQFRKTMRGSSDSQATTSSDTRMRTSMRPGGSVTAVGASPGLAASRHSMAAPGSQQPVGTLQKKKLPAAVVPQKGRPQSVPAPTKKMAIAPSYDSDSDASASSFQRERQRRRGPRNGTDRYSMRRSMRADNPPTMRGSPGVRPISPPAAQAFPPPPSFRKSLRPSSPISDPGATKSSRFSMRSLSPAGRFTLGKASKPKAASPATSQPAFSSRFQDSSDEEFEDRSKHFQSRFADSDDEDEFQLPPGLAPVRGIPKRVGDDDRDSTDLEDEDSDVERAGASKTLENGLSASTNGHVSGLQKSKHAPELPSFNAGKKGKAKRGLFRLGKKKAVAAEPSDAETEFPSGPSADIPLPPPHRQRDPSRPLTPIGEEKAIEVAPPQRSPKLQRRLTPQWGRSVSDSWPLPSPVGAEEARPQTSDGPATRKTSLRSTLSKGDASRPPTARTAIDPKTGKEVVVGRTGKKKKFQGLRRVFGLND